MTELFLVWLLLVAPAGASPEIISAGPGFHRFVEASPGQSPDRLVELWSELVEAPHSVFYKELVWDADWAPYRQRKLQLVLPRLLANAAALEDLFRQLPEVATRQVERFQEVFPDARLDMPVYIVPSFRFNGRSATLPEKGLVLALAPDEIARLHDDPDVLVSHELFHVYHVKRLGLSSEIETPGCLLAPLWLEGLATYYSAHVNPGAGEAQVLMQEDLTKVGEADVRWLATHFPIQGGSYGEWFQTGTGRARADLPARCGYLLGLRVVERLAERHGLQEMAGWNLEEAQRHVREALGEMASPAGAAALRRGGRGAARGCGRG